METSFGGQVRIFKTHIPSTVKVGEANYLSLPIVQHDPGGKAAAAYTNFTREFLHCKPNREVFISA